MISVCLVVLVAMAKATQFQYADEWSIWKSTHSKSYASEEVGREGGGEVMSTRCISQSIHDFVHRRKYFAMQCGSPTRSTLRIIMSSVLIRPDSP